MRSIKKFVSLVILLGVITICVHNSFAHSGRTDSNGGHKDNKNVSGLGSYHYHHGYGPHLHPDGVCPYEEKQEAATPPKEEKQEAVITANQENQENQETAASVKESVKEEKKEAVPAKAEKELPEPQIVAVESVRIDSKNKVTLDINETLTLNAIVNPDEAANKNVTWSSSDTSVATVDNMGVITAISAGDTVITAIANNGKKDSITLSVISAVEIEEAFSEQETKKEIESKADLDSEQPAGIVSQESKDSKDKLTENKDEESDSLTTGLGLTGAAIAFILYNTFKKKKK